LIRQKVPVNVYTFSTPISVLFWVSVLRTEQNQVLAVVQSLFCPSLMDVDAVLHLRIFFVLRVEIGFLFGAKFFLSY
jgi:hypothetical protein